MPSRNVPADASAAAAAAGAAAAGAEARTNVSVNQLEDWTTQAAAYTRSR